jgi:hypothetical protein
MLCVNLDMLDKRGVAITIGSNLCLDASVAEGALLCVQGDAVQCNSGTAYRPALKPVDGLVAGTIIEDIII